MALFHPTLTGSAKGSISGALRSARLGRRRFEHFWGWAYRFEAYTPAARRVRGYYAMPLLWCDAPYGWANARIDARQLKIEVGFVGKRPGDSSFDSELDAEIERLHTFLDLEIDYKKRISHKKAQKAHKSGFYVPYVPFCG